ncbi:hypothetical protein GQX74_001940, partial [Glossina fuscipes]
ISLTNIFSALPSLYILRYAVLIAGKKIIRELRNDEKELIIKTDRGPYERNTRVPDVPTSRTTIQQKDAQLSGQHNRVLKGITCLFCRNLSKVNLTYEKPWTYSLLNHYEPCKAVQAENLHRISACYSINGCTKYPIGRSFCFHSVAYARESLYHHHHHHHHHYEFGNITELMSHTKGSLSDCRHCHLNFTIHACLWIWQVHDELSTSLPKSATNNLIFLGRVK